MSFNWSVLLAHNHWITISIQGRDVRLCARCLGVVVGGLALFTATYIVNLTFFLALPISWQVAFCIGLTLPAVFDWVTQTWGFRESFNRLRVSTGILEGAGVVFLSLTALPAIQKIAIVLLIGGVTLNIGYAGRRIRRNFFFPKQQTCLRT